MLTIAPDEGWDADIAHGAGPLVLLRIYLGKYRDREMDGEALTNLGAVLDWFHRQGTCMILRGVYDVDGQGMAHDPRTLALAVRHIEQLGQVVSAHPAGVLLFQGLLIGSWGEMHSSLYTGSESLRTLWQAMERAMPESVFLAVRQPAQWRTLRGERENCGRLGLFNDALLSSDTEMGTFGSKSRSETGWVGQWLPGEDCLFGALIAEVTPYGGEAVGAGAAVLPADQVVRALRERHIAYLNTDWDPQVIDAWRSRSCGEGGIWSGISLYEYIGAHLGYRFSVSGVSCSGKLFERVRTLSFTICNTGTARFFRTPRMAVTLEYPDGRETQLAQEGDIREIAPGSSLRFTAVLDAPDVAGVRIWLSLISVEDEVPVRLANEGYDERGRLLLGEFR